MSPERIVCPCLKVTEGEVRQAIITHRLRSIEDITCSTEAGDGCTACHLDLERIIREVALEKTRVS